MFSIIIPAHNSLQILETNLKSIFSKVNTDDDVILVDDKSTDSTLIRDLAEKFGARYFFISLETNYNRCAAINKGVENAKQDWIIELDQDKIPVKDTYFHTLRSQTNSDDNYRIVRFGHTLNHFPLSIKQNFIGKDNKASFNAIVGGNVCYHKIFFDEVGRYDSAFDGSKGFQDFDLFYRMQINGGELLFVENMLADHIDSHIKSNEMYKTNMDKFFNKHGFYPEVN